MAVYALTGTYCTINAHDHSSDLKGVTVTVDAAQLDSTDFASEGWVEVIGGLKSGTLALEFQDDADAGEVDSQLWALLGTVVAFEFRKTSASPTTSNPEYTGNVLITSHSIGGAVGELAMKSLSFPTSGAVARVTE